MTNINQKIIINDQISKDDIKNLTQKWKLPNNIFQEWKLPNNIFQEYTSTTEIS